MICEHPRITGFLVYCPDCDLTAEGRTKEQAIENWQDGKTKCQSFDRSELIDGKPL